MPSFVIPNEEFTQDGTYIINVRAIDKSGNTSEVSSFNYERITDDTIIPYTPQNVNISTYYGKNLITWDMESAEELPGTISFNVYKGTTENFTPSEDNLIADNIKTLYYMDMEVGGTSYYKVKAVKTGTNTSSGSSSTGNPTSSSINPIIENSVKIRSINASETSVEPVSVKARNKKEANDTETEDNYIIITKDVTDVQFTITLDNPEAYGIDALRVTCDDPEAQIQVEGEWKPISQEANGTRVVNWSSEDPYEKTYNIRTTSLEDLYTFKVVDIRLAGHDTFCTCQEKLDTYQSLIKTLVQK